MHDDFYQMYLDEMKEIVPCTKEEQDRLVAEAALGDEAARKRLVEGNLETALEYAKAYGEKGVALTDLVQEANMALIMAVDEFLSDMSGLKFDEFVGDWIRRSLQAAVDEQQSADQTGEELTARINVLQTVSKVLAQELGREATMEELADKMKMTVEEIRVLMKMAMEAMSLGAEVIDDESMIDESMIDESVDEI